MNNKKIVVIIGSPRRNGNSSALAQSLIEGAQKKGANVEKFIIQEMNIKPCTGCDKCITKSGSGCVNRAATTLWHILRTSRRGSSGSPLAGRSRSKPNTGCNFRLGENLDYTTNLYLYMSPEFPLYINWDTWNSLPAGTQLPKSVTLFPRVDIPAKKTAGTDMNKEKPSLPEIKPEIDIKTFGKKFKKPYFLMIELAEG